MGNKLLKQDILIAVFIGLGIYMSFYENAIRNLNIEANSTVQTMLFFCLLFAASVWDIRKRIIPDVICAAILLTGMMSFTPDKAFGVLLGLPLLIAALIKEGGMGGGDIKLTAASGFVLGFPSGVAGLIIALVAVLFYHLGLRIIHKAGQKKPPVAKETAVPMAPFLSVGFILASIFN